MSNAAQTPSLRRGRLVWPVCSRPHVSDLCQKLALANAFCHSAGQVPGDVEAILWLSRAALDEAQQFIFHHERDRRDLDAVARLADALESNVRGLSASWSPVAEPC